MKSIKTAPKKLQKKHVRKFRPSPYEIRRERKRSKKSVAPKSILATEKPFPDPDGTANLCGLQQSNASNKIVEQQISFQVTRSLVRHNWSKPDADFAAKAQKFYILDDIDIYIRQYKPKLSPRNLAELFLMIDFHISRTLPILPRIVDPRGFNVREDGEVAEPSFEHLNVVYSILRAIVKHCPEKELLPYIHVSFVRKICDNFASPDSHERLVLRIVLHRIYNKMVVQRPLILNEIIFTLTRNIYEVEQHFGIAELLEVLLAIINGFKKPLKPVNLAIFSYAVLPLHNCRNYVTFSKPLTQCISKYVEKQGTLGLQALQSIIRYWPKCSSLKKVAMIQEFQTILDLIPFQEVQKWTPETRKFILSHLSKQLSQEHAELSLATFGVWKDASFLNLLNEYLAEILEIFIPNICQAAFHWHHSVRQTAENLLLVLQEAYPEEFHRIFVNWKTYLGSQKEKKGKSAYSGSKKLGKWSSSKLPKKSLSKTKLVVIVKPKRIPIQPLKLKPKPKPRPTTTRAKEAKILAQIHQVAPKCVNIPKKLAKKNSALSLARKEKKSTRKKSSPHAMDADTIYETMAYDKIPGRLEPRQLKRVPFAEPSGKHSAVSALYEALDKYESVPKTNRDPKRAPLTDVYEAVETYCKVKSGQPCKFETIPSKDGPDHDSEYEILDFRAGKRVTNYPNAGSFVKLKPRQSQFVCGKGGKGSKETKETSKTPVSPVSQLKKIVTKQDQAGAKKTRRREPSISSPSTTKGSTSSPKQVASTAMLFTNPSLKQHTEEKQSKSRKGSRRSRRKAKKLAAANHSSADSFSGQQLTAEQKPKKRLSKSWRKTKKLLSNMFHKSKKPHESASKQSLTSPADHPKTKSPVHKRLGSESK